LQAGELRFIIFGPPGAGKGTYASMLASKLNLVKISTGDIIREEIKQETKLGNEVADFVNKGDLVPDDITIEIVKEKIAEAAGRNGFILDGYPRTIEQAKALEVMGEMDAVIRLIVPEQVIIERLSSRRVCGECGAVYNVRFLKPKTPGICDVCGGELYQREDDKPAVIRDRLKVYEAQTQPLIKYYEGNVPFVNVECNSVEIPPKTIVEKIIHKLEEKSLV
jgi:adenylate kinase